jgi:DNA repair exonuclease SbcCD ATPase subunit
MSLFNVYETVKRAIQDVVAPELQAIRGDNAALRSELQRVEATLTMRLDQTTQRLTQVENRLDGLGERLGRVEVAVTTRMDQMDQRLTQVENRLDGLGERLGRVEVAVGETQVALLRFAQDTEARFKELHAEVAHQREVMDVNIRRLEERMDANLRRIDNDLGAIKERLQMAIDIHERLATLEARVG